MEHVDDHRMFVGTCKTEADALVFIDVKSFDGWSVLVPPFASKQTIIGDGEETARPIDTEWTFVLHRV